MNYKCRKCGKEIDAPGYCENCSLILEAEVKGLQELVRQGYDLSAYAASARQRCTVEYLEDLFDRITAFQAQVPEELKTPTMKGLRPKLNKIPEL